MRCVVWRGMSRCGWRGTRWQLVCPRASEAHLASLLTTDRIGDGRHSALEGSAESRFDNYSIAIWLCDRRCKKSCSQSQCHQGDVPMPDRLTGGSHEINRQGFKLGAWPGHAIMPPHLNRSAPLPFWLRATNLPIEL